MSWLFGYRRPDHGGNPTIPELPPQTPGDAGANKPPAQHVPVASGMMEAYRFDSSALERAAKAAKELESSKHAKDFLELSRQQEISRQAEEQRKMREFEAYMMDKKGEQMREHEELRRKTIAEETRQAQQRAQYQDQLARKRYDDQLVQQQRMNEDNLRKQEESVAKQEQIRLAAMEREMELAAKRDIQRVEAKVRAQAEADRKNKDIDVEKMRVKYAEEREMALAKIKTMGTVLGSGLHDFLTDKTKITGAVVGVSLLFASYYTTKRASRVIADYVHSYVTKPKLVRETSRYTLETIKHPYQAAKRAFAKQSDSLEGTVFSPDLESRLRDIAIATKNTRRNKGSYPKLLFYGPPGTGKTMFAKKLAKYSEMNYAIMTGGDVRPMGAAGVTAIHRLFDWAERSPRGLMLFIDEADGFLRKRKNEVISEDVRTMISAFLHRTSTRSNKFMLILASNTPEQFDFAINNRIDLVVEFPLPGLEERERLVRLYFDEFILTPASKGARRLKVDNFDYNQVCSEVARLTDGFSGREISKLGIAWQNACYTSDDGILTRELVMDRVSNSLQTFRVKQSWQSTSERSGEYVPDDKPLTSATA